MASERHKRYLAKMGPTVGLDLFSSLVEDVLSPQAVVSGVSFHDGLCSHSEDRRLEDKGEYGWEG